MVDPVSSSGAASGGFAEALGANKSLGKEAFLKLLVAQLKHQDPLKPQDDSAFVAELAQFSSLEQTMGINDRLDLLSAQSQGLQNSQVTSLVGKLATVRGSLITSEGKGVGVPVAFSLDTALLYERGEVGLAALYVVGSVALSIGGLFGGLALVRHFT